MSKLLITFAYDTVSGMYEGRVSGGQGFYFSSHRDAPMPQQITNALEALRRLTMLEAQAPKTAGQKSETLPLDEVLGKIREYEARGGTVQHCGRVARPAYTSLSLDDLEID